jgi:uncharacterized membrane protein (DUF485 family)
MLISQANVLITPCGDKQRIYCLHSLISLLVAGIIGLITAGCVYLFRVKFGWHSLTFTNIGAVAIGSLIGLLIMAGIYAMFPRKEYDEVKNLIKIWKSAKLDK